MNEKMFASWDYTAGQLKAIVKKLKEHGEDGPERFLRGELTVSAPARSWREQDGIIYFTVTSDGTTGPQWIERLEKKGFRIGVYAKSVLRSEDFKSTNGVTTEVGVLGGELFTDNERSTKNIRLKAVKSKMILPEAEVACLIREKFSDKEIEAMGLWRIVVMHKPIKDSDGDPYLLGAYRCADGRWLDVYDAYPDFRWSRADGFAFAVSQVSS